MRLLVVYGSSEIVERARAIMEKYPYKWIFIRDSDVDFSADRSIELSEYDIIFSLHCEKIFPEWLVKSQRCINIHPGYNPYNRGMFPHVWSIINGLPTGATIHLMDEKIDHGHIYCRQQVPVTLYDTSATLYQRVIESELFLLQTRLEDIIEERIVPFTPEIEGNYNSLADFKKLCEIKLQEHGKTYNLLRALTHGKYKNAKLGNRYLKLEII